MKKIVKILSFISLGIIALSVMGVALCYVYREPLMELFFHSGAELPAAVPVGSAVALIGQLGAVIWLCVCVGDRRFGIWAELLTAGWLGAVLPGITRLLSQLQSMLLVRFKGTDYLLAQSNMDALWSYATVLNGVAVALALVVCGLSMADKWMHTTRK